MITQVINNFKLDETDITCFVFKEDTVGLQFINGQALFPSFNELQHHEFDDCLLLKTIDNCQYLAAKSGNNDIKAVEFKNLRDLYGSIDEKLWRIACDALHIINWSEHSKYCSKCGGLNSFHPIEIAKECGSCNELIYPRINPCVIVAITKGDKILLASSAKFPSQDIYSVIAGYVEIGETLEECLKREIKEELNITVKNIKYFGSQSWAFSNSLMIGFTAEYDSGELCINQQELLDARWFSANELPMIARPGSIARDLIDSLTHS